MIGGASGARQPDTKLAASSSACRTSGADARPLIPRSARSAAAFSRIIRGYDEYNTILLPPRAPHEKLPLELYDFYDEQLKRLEDEERRPQKEEQLNMLDTNSAAEHNTTSMAHTHFFVACFFILNYSLSFS